MSRIRVISGLPLRKLRRKRKASGKLSAGRASSTIILRPRIGRRVSKLMFVFAPLTTKRERGSSMSRANINASLRRRRALRCAIGERRFVWRPMDRLGRIPFGLPRVCKSLPEVIQQCHEWLDRYRCSGQTLRDSWWFSYEERAYDEALQYSSVVKTCHVLVYHNTLWTGYRPCFYTSDRKGVPCG